MVDPKLMAAIELVRSGELLVARQTLEQLAADAPGNPDIWLWLAAASTGEQRHTHLLRAFALAPHDPRVIAALEKHDGAILRPEPSTATARPPKPAPVRSAYATPRFAPTKRGRALSNAQIALMAGGALMFVLLVALLVPGL